MFFTEIAVKKKNILNKTFSNVTPQACILTL